MQRFSERQASGVDCPGESGGVSTGAGVGVGGTGVGVGSVVLQLKASISTGTEWFVRSPFPSCPCELAPQHLIEHVPVHAQACANPEVSATTDVSPVTFTGVAGDGVGAVG